MPNLFKELIELIEEIKKILKKDER